jgi:protein-disulfide isomerase
VVDSNSPYPPLPRPVTIPSLPAQPGPFPSASARVILSYMNSAALRPASRFLAHAALAAALGASLGACGSAGAETATDTATSPGTSSASSASSASTAATPAPDSAREALIARADAGRIKGSPAASLWLVVISDFECPFCKKWHDETAPRIEREYVRTGKIRIAYLNFPIPSHRNAQPAHEFTMCAAEQGKFWPAADAVFETQQLWKRRNDAAAYFDSLGTGIGVDRARLRACVNGGQTRPLIEADYRRSVRIGIGSTPTFLIGDQAIIGAQPFEAFKAAIDAALASGGSR